MNGRRQPGDTPGGVSVQMPGILPEGVRIAHSADLEAIVAIYNQTIPTRMATADLEPVSVESRRAWFAGHVPGRYPLWVAERAGEIAGWLGFQRFHDRCAYEGTAEISVYVHEAHRRAGIARLLLCLAVDRAPALGLEALVGLILARNTPSLALFQGAGFEVWGRLPRVARLDGVPEDLVIVGRPVCR